MTLLFSFCCFFFLNSTKFRKISPTVFKLGEAKTVFEGSTDSQKGCLTMSET